MPHVTLEISYPDLFAAIGKLIADKKMQDVCVVEFEDGVIINGSIVYEGREDMRRAQETFVLNRLELSKLVSGKRNLFGR